MKRLAFGALLLARPLAAQDVTAVYVRDPDPLVQQKLAQWQDLKLGLLMHWGTYSQWGIVELWSLCAEDEGWCRSRQRDSIGDYAAYKRAYEALQTTVNPLRFDPARWAQAAKGAGMRYVVFTTKHHDGFSMFGTHETDYRITSSRTPFSTSPNADVTRGIFDAFRTQGFMIGAYFSKPDWHSPDYWWPYFATPDRNPNYDIKKYPDRWAHFVAFTQVASRTHPDARRRRGEGRQPAAQHRPRPRWCVGRRGVRSTRRARYVDEGQFGGDPYHQTGRRHMCRTPSLHRTHMPGCSGCRASRADYCDRLAASLPVSRRGTTRRWLMIWTTSPC